MYPLKQSTAITVPVFGHDVNGDAVTGMVDGGFTKRISKNGGAFAAMTVTITELENGFYSVPLSTAHTDTLGILTIIFTNASSKQINLQFRVHARVPDDLAFPATTGRSIDVTTGGAVGIDWANIEAQGTSVNLSATTTNLVNTTTTNTDVRGTDSALLASSAPTNFGDLSITVTTGLVDITQAAADKAWSTAARILTANTNFNDISAADVWSEATRVLTASTNFNDLSAAQVNTEVDNALNTAIPGGPTTNSINQRVLAIDDLSQAAGAGDLAAILTDTGELQGDTHTAAEVWTSGTRSLTDKVGFSLAVGGVIDGAIAAAELLNIADGCLDRRLDLGTDTGGDTTTTRTWRDALRVLRNRADIVAGTLTVYEEDDTTTAFTAAISTAAGNPIAQVNPT